MKLSINKIGKIKEANIEINGLTVIAGLNDTGKSTVGKILYAVFRALKFGPVFFDETQKRVMLANDVIPLCRKYLTLPQANPRLLQEISLLLEKEPSMLPGEITKLENLSFEELRVLILKIRETLSTQEVSAEFLTFFQNIEETFHKNKTLSLDRKFAYTLSRTLNVMFGGDVRNSKHKDSGSLEILQHEKSVMKAETMPTLTASLDNVLKNSIYGDVVYLESPLLMDLLDLKSNIRLKPHWGELRDLMYLEALPQKWAGDSVNKELLDFIQQEIFKNSQVSFDSKRNEFVYQVDETAEKISMINVACGVKSFVLLFLILKLNILKKDVVLVVDEPENHLHPSFQIKYAELIALMVKRGFSVVLTSHSPTMIQALAYYTEGAEFKRKTSFYLATQIEEENYSRFENVSDDLERIYSNLITPTDKLFDFLLEK